MIVDNYFNPRTREGCDFRLCAVGWLCQHFNPRTREGCDDGELMPVCADDRISIHAPVKGATFMYFLI